MKSKNKKVYIDYNATTPLAPEVKTSMIEDSEIFANASSMHASGRLARSKIEQARNSVASLIGTDADSVIFTSGGSEANNTVFQTMRRLALERKDRNEFIITAIEHPCVLNSAMNIKNTGFNVKILPVDKYGKVNQEEIKNALSEKTLFVSVMAANNETGVIQDIRQIAAMAKKAGAFFHTDAVQAAGKITVNVKDFEADYLTLSAHKIYGPKGVGALYIKKGAPLFPLIHGGHQENGLRAGTYNNTGILGFGMAAELAKAKLARYGNEITALRDKLHKGLIEKIPKIKINGHPKNTLPNTLNVSFPGAEGEAILLSMDMQGIEASTGSACASGSLDPSHVLLAMGIGQELAHSSIRFSLGWGITEDDINYIIDTLPPIIAKLRAMSTLTVA
jgi:cysteine desulfurase